MSKKDKVALTISVIVLMWSLVIMASGAEAILFGLLCLTGLIGYWGYRYTKNDISFLRDRD